MSMRSSTSSESSRLEAVDGLRAVAVLGVMWAHVWSFGCGAPSMPLPGLHVDLNRVVSALGTGVDLFFVISGFCMYLMHARKQTTHSAHPYLEFVANRFRRIAPAFYVSIAGSVAFNYILTRRLPVFEALATMLFGHLWFKPLQLNPVFWSLATEWHFYLMLPVLLFVLGKRRFRSGMAALVVLSVLCRIAQAYWLPDSIGGANIPFRLVEFLWGIAVARCYVQGRRPPAILLGAKGALIGTVVAYVGRILMTREATEAFGSWGPFGLALSIPILALGYAIILWSVVSQPSMVSRVLGSGWSRSIGRWSYSIYLWHWYPSLLISRALVDRFGAGPWMPYVATCASLFIVLPVSILSYQVLEKPYFRRREERLQAAPV